jgi:hypothetical protein
MQKKITDSPFFNCFGSNKRLRHDGCGLINCRPRCWRRQSVHNEIQAILEARCDSAQSGCQDGRSRMAWLSGILLSGTEKAK